ncbi:hypothetical protein [Paenibacillus sp. MMS18-CY102]|uniref:hypothetical protein n=1 Tax=Paenibacillus sp. MMS18-CY102 TaxID=2682849 RepID=UPI001365D170|nr:hypothetical protein [Paenibacillus sp. MMS18-CY102]MWC27177.1 hypothetical protein [Paenibacillus sp. MMS18-CY102]
MNMLSSEFSQARRSAGQGDCIWTNYQQDELWEYFIDNLWKYQWTQERVPLTKAIRDMLYEQSQGIPDIAIKLYQIVQWQVIGQEERFTAETIRQVAKESLRLVQPILDALRANDTDKLREISDIYAPIRDISKYLNQTTERIELEGALNTIRNQQQASRDEDDSPLVEVAKWLQEAGYDTQRAIECAEMAIARSVNESDIARIKQAAFAFALNIAMPEASEQQTAPTKQRTRTKRLPVDAAKFPGDLRGVLAKASSDGLNPIEELSKTGLFETNADFNLEGDH